MKFLDGYPEVFTHLLQQQKLAEQGDPEHENYAPVGVALSGTMRGVTFAYQMSVLEHLQLVKLFKAFIGVSTGAPPIAYGLAEQCVLGRSVYLEECLTESFMRTPVSADSDYLSRVFRVGHKALNESAARRAKPDFFAAATCAKTGNGILFNAKTIEPDMVQALHASIAIPGMTGPVAIGDSSYLDGVGAHPFPIQEAAALNPTGLIIFANAPGQISDEEITASKTAWTYLTRRLPAEVREQYVSSAARFNEGLAWLKKESPCPWVILWCDPNISIFERDYGKLHGEAMRAEEQLLSLFSEAAELAKAA